MNELDRSFRLLPPQASEMAGKVDLLGLYLLGVTVFFTLLILVLIVYFALRYRRNMGDIHLPNPPDVHTSPTLEIAWSGIPLFLVMIMFVWAAKLYVEQSTAAGRVQRKSMLSANSGCGSSSTPTDGARLMS